MTITAPSRTLPAATAESGTVVDPRIQAFCSPTGAEIFHSIVQEQFVWSPDPFDVEGIHEEARNVFKRLVERAGSSTSLSPGRILLLLGEAGSGKTHLMRAFRHYVHDNDRGYCGYMQMTSLLSNYASYILSKLIDALDKPYCPPGVQTTGLMRLSFALLDTLPEVTAEERQRFRDGYVPDLVKSVESYADKVLSDVRFSNCDLDLVRALLYLQRDESRVKIRVLKWLRCEDMSANDRAVLGDLVPRPQEHKPLEMIHQLGQVMRAAHVTPLPLVLCVDQMEQMSNEGAAPDQFRRAMNTLIEVTEKLPGCVIVVACLEDYYAAHKNCLGKSKEDRLERDPEPIRLSGPRTTEEIEWIAAQRLRHLYDEEEAPFDEHTSTFPFTKEQLASQTGKRTRDVLDFLRCHRERCIQAGAWLVPSGAEPIPPVVKPPEDKLDVLPLEQEWNDFPTTFKTSVPDGEEALADLLGWGIKQCSEEMPPGYFFGMETNGRMIPVDVHLPADAVEQLYVAVCEKGAQGGGLGRQITEAERNAGDIPIVIVRTTNFPSTKSAVSTQIGVLVKRGGRRVVVENTDWRRLLAFQQFHAQRHKAPAFVEWVRENKPLSQIGSIRQILDLDRLLKNRPASVPVAAQVVRTEPLTLQGQVTPTPSVSPVSVVAAGHLLLGMRTGLSSAPVMIDPQELTQHAAFLGGSGSGKTTAALNLIEQLLERGIPVVLLDRKGDLCRYADPSAWNEPLPDAQEASRRQALRGRLDVAVFTPGEPNGRPLSIPVVPEGFDQLGDQEREQIAGYAAASLGQMMGYKPKGTDQSRLAILRKAIEVLGTVSGHKVNLSTLHQFVEDRDPTLQAAIGGGFHDRHYSKLSEELLTLNLQKKNLLEGAGEQLDIDALLGLRNHARHGRSRLSILSTRALGDAVTVDFWVSQLLVVLGRWIGRHPSSQLQGVFLFDEADQYLPAQRQPATKSPMENLLKRARSAGIGLMLATQSPGDFDYKCRDNIRTWLVGRVKEQTSLNKLKPMLSECKVDVTSKLAGQETGQFHLIREREVCSVRSNRSLLKTEQIPEDRILELARTCDRIRPS